MFKNDKMTDFSIVYLAHPVSDDPIANTDSILVYLREIQFQCPNVIPIAPYLVCLRYLNDDEPKEREMGFTANYQYFEKGFVDELWLCGERVSSGMQKEIRWCYDLGIPVKCYEPHLKSELRDVLDTIERERLLN